MNLGDRFSDELEQWLGTDVPKSLGTLGDVFAEKSFAVAIMLLMVVSATPIPTGGVNLLFQLVAAVIGAQMALGRQTIWLPDRWRKRELGGVVTAKAVPFLVRRIRWFEKHSRPRLAALFQQRLFIRMVGLLLTAFAIAAGLAPPFSGLETLPALGAVIVAIAMILEDIVVLTVGVVIGATGIAIFVSVGAVVVRIVRHFV